MKWLRDFFNINRRQERGMWFLSVLLLVAVLVLYLSSYIFNTPFEPYDADKQARIDSLQWVKQYDNPDDRSTAIAKRSNPRSFLKPFVFYPNTVSEEALAEMNLPKRLVKQWINYRRKGGKFATAKDVSRLYAMDSATFAVLKPYMRFATISNAKSNSKNTKANSQKRPKKAKEDQITKQAATVVTAKPLLIGINTADSVTLLQVKGIGPYYAGAIVKYRKRLGGYVDLTQLMELYKMDEKRYTLWCASLYLDSLSVKQLSVNTATFKELLKHPYIDYNTTKYIINQRQKLGRFAALYQLKDDQMMPDSLYRKLLPYICL